MRKFSYCLWFANEAEEAANFYSSTFKNSKVENVMYSKDGERLPEGSVLMAMFSLNGEKFTALNGNPGNKFTPAFSFTVECETEEEINNLWEILTEDGGILMGIGQYPFSERFGWCCDKFGMSWQLTLSKTPQRVVPHLMFVGDQFGKAEEAMELYAGIFPDSGTKKVMRAPDESLYHAGFHLGGSDFTIADSGANHMFTFSDATSICVHCKTQEEINHIWNTLTSDGGEEMMCFWLKDKFGVTWQVIPENFFEIMGGEAGKAQSVMKAMFGMKKPILAELEAASKG